MKDLNLILREIVQNCIRKLAQLLLKILLHIIPNGYCRYRLFHSSCMNSDEDGAQIEKNTAIERQKEIQYLRIILPSELYSLSENAPPPYEYDIFVLPIIDWHFRFQRPQQIARAMAKHGHRIFYVDTTFADQLGARQIEENIYGITLPGPKELNIYTSTLEKGQIEIWNEAIKELAQQFGIDKTILLVDLPFWGPLALSLRERFGWKIVYDCMDRHKGFTTNSREMVAQEENLSRKSDLILVSSLPILDDQRKFNNNVIYLPNAADFSHFYKSSGAVPEELEGIHHPIFGYYGAISDWFDTETVGWLAKKRPDWEFVLIGSTYGGDLRPFKALSNIHLLGEKNYQKIPDYLHQFDVCLIPFKKTPLTEATNPVKLFEYLSAGKSVVATNLEELKNYSDYIYLVNKPEDWITAMESALNESDQVMINERIRFAQQNTWETRITVIENIFKYN